MDWNNKARIVEHGRQYEEDFLAVLEALGYEAIINPAKRDDPYAYDLLVDDAPADLKVQTHPFLTAGRYGRDPRWTVTLNRKDVERYSSYAPHITIYFWVSWHHHQERVRALYGIWRCCLDYVLYELAQGRLPEHHYLTRQTDTQGNARSSYLLDLRDIECLASGLEERWGAVPRDVVHSAPRR